MTKQENHQQNGQAPKRPKKAKWLANLIGGEMLQNAKVLKYWPLIVMIGVYAIILVSVRYKVEDLTKEKLATQERINCLRETRIELQKRYQETIKISQIASLLDSTGVGITAGPPYEI